jgi:hypothetical protein
VLGLDVALLSSGEGRENLALWEEEAFAAVFGVDRNGGSDVILDPVGWEDGGTLVSDEIKSGRRGNMEGVLAPEATGDGGELAFVVEADLDVVPNQS